MEHEAGNGQQTGSQEIHYGTEIHSQEDQWNNTTPNVCQIAICIDWLLHSGSLFHGVITHVAVFTVFITGMTSHVTPLAFLRKNYFHY
jgi:hypothetical protein